MRFVYATRAVHKTNHNTKVKIATFSDYYAEQLQLSVLSATASAIFIKMAALLLATVGCLFGF